MKKVLLFFPNTSNDGVLPLAIASLSAIAKEEGYDVRYFETTFYKKRPTAAEDRESTGEFKKVERVKQYGYLPYEQILQDLVDELTGYDPDILAVSANSLEYELFRELAENLADELANTFVIVGGVHATVVPEKVIVDPFVNAVCVGEGEDAWKDFLRKFRGDGDITGIMNIWYKTPKGVVRNAVRPLLTAERLWATPLDLSLFDERHVLSPFDGKMYHRGQIEMSRGCPYSCNYCVNTSVKSIYRGKGKWFRVRPFESVRQEVSRRVAMGADMLQLQDECFLAVSTETLVEFCRWYAKNVGLPLMIQSRPESVTDEKVAIIAKMGCPVQISLGVESGSERILREICNRQMSLEMMRSAFEIIKKYKIRSTAYTMIGFPTETRKEAFETIEFIRSNPIDIAIMSTFYPFEGVPLRALCLEKGYITGNERASTFTDKSILKNQPMSVDEIDGIRRTFAMYTRLPKRYFPEIELCERDPEKHRDTFQKLVHLLHTEYYNSWEV